MIIFALFSTVIIFERGHGVCRARTGEFAIFGFFAISGDMVYAVVAASGLWYFFLKYDLHGHGWLFCHSNMEVRLPMQDCFCLCTSARGRADDPDG